MENRENKLIADKINSLENLPEGYNPNLEAKWALLQSEEKESKGIIYFFSKNRLKIAAIFLIAFLSTVFMVIKLKNTSTEFSDVSPVVSPSIESKTFDQKTALPRMSTLQKPTEKRTTGTTFHTKPVEKKNNPDVVLDNSLPEEQISFQENVRAEILPLEETVLAKTENKKSRQRYIQMDFDDEINSGNDKNTFAQGFQFRLGIKNMNPINRNSDNNTNLTLKRNF
ncbi:MAG: hypothetical protein ACO1G6_00455 [Bacteroidota bacterium]